MAQCYASADEMESDVIAPQTVLREAGHGPQTLEIWHEGNRLGLILATVFVYYILDTSVRLINCESREHLSVKLVEHVDINSLEAEPITCGPKFDLSRLLLVYDAGQRSEHAAYTRLVIGRDNHHISLSLTEMRKNSRR